MDKLNELKEKISLIQAKSAVAPELKAFATLFLKVLAEAKSDFSNISKENQAKIDQAFAYLEQEHEKIENNVSQLTEKAKTDFNIALESVKSLVAELKSIEYTNGKDGENGKDADEEKIIEEVLSKIPKQEEETGETIVDKINALSLEEENKIDAKHIKNLPKPTEIRGGGTKFLQYLADVNIQTPTDGQVLTYDDTTKTWKNEAGGSGGGTWGSITGTLSNQTDLQTALDTKANSTGALTQFIGNGNWKVFYSDGSGDVQELALGASGTFLKSNGVASAPTFATPSGTGDMLASIYDPAGINQQLVGLTASQTLTNKTITAGIFGTSMTGSYLTASTILIADGSKNIISADTATYPSLTELSYLKGATSSIQTQLNSKGTGNVSKVGTPVNNQVGVWTGDGTLEGDVDLTFDTTTNTLATGIVTVSDDAYGAGWNGSTAVPTKNAIYDKIETITAGTTIDYTTNFLFMGA